MSSGTQTGLAKGKHRTRVTAILGVETAGANEEIEIPMIVGVLSDLSGARARAQSVDKREPLEINGDNFSNVMKGIAPEVELKIPTLPQEVRLTFTHMDDFSPERIAEAVPALRELMVMRRKLKELENRINSNPAAEGPIAGMLGDFKKEHLK